MKTWLLFALSILPLTACRADDETRQGDVDEYCNGYADDCRPGLSCVDFVCVPVIGALTEYTCADFCAHMSECGAGDSSCVADCGATIRDWSFDAQDSFTRCGAVELTCDEINATFAPQECYSRIPIASDRQARCSQFYSSVQACDGSLDALTPACLRLARVGTDDMWAETDRCANAVDVGTCSSRGACLNEVFSLDPAL